MTGNVLMVDGFDMYSGTVGPGVRWIGGGPGVVAGRFGGQALQVAGAGVATTATFDGTGTLATTGFSAGFAFQINDLPSNQGNFFFKNAAGASLIIVELLTTGAIAVQNGAGTTLCTSAAGLVNPVTWYHLGLEVVLSATIGTVNLYLSGALVASATGANTLPSAGGVAMLTVANWPFLGHFVLVDDLYITDSATWLGECRVETLRPASDNTKVWTPNSGTTNYSRVNETVVDGDASYVSTASTGVRDLYTIAGLSSTPVSIKAVNVVSFAEKTDATTRQLYNSVRSSSTDSDGAAFNLLSSYNRFDRIIQVDPATSAAWTPSGVNNLLIGPKAA